MPRLSAYQTDEDRRRLLWALDALLSCGRWLPASLLDEAFRFRRTVADSLPEEPEEEDGPDKEEQAPTGHVIPFRLR